MVINNQDDLIEFEKEYKRDYEESTNKFILETSKGDILQVVLRGHLYIEHELTTIIKRQLENPDHYIKDGMMFAQKLNLAYALGCLNKDEKAAYAKLNTIRNKYVHELDYKLTEQEFMNFINTFDSNQRVHYDKLIQARLSRDLLAKFIYAITILWVEVRNHVLLYDLNQYLSKEKAEHEIILKLKGKII